MAEIFYYLIELFKSQFDLFVLMAHFRRFNDGAHCYLDMYQIKYLFLRP